MKKSRSKKLNFGRDFVQWEMEIYPMPSTLHTRTHALTLAHLHTHALTHARPVADTHTRSPIIMARHA